MVPPWCGRQFSPQSPGPPGQPPGTGPERDPEARVRKSCLPTAGFLFVVANPASASEQSDLSPARLVHSPELQREATWAAGSRARVGCLPGPPRPGSRAPASLSGCVISRYFPCFTNAEVTALSSRGARALFLFQGPGQGHVPSFHPAAPPSGGARGLAARRPGQGPGACAVCSTSRHNFAMAPLNSCTSVPGFFQLDGVGPLVLPRRPRRPPPTHWTCTGARHSDLLSWPGLQSPRPASP